MAQICNCLSLSCQVTTPGVHCNTSAVDHMFRTPLHWAAVLGFEEVLSFLLEVGSNPAVGDVQGALPLHYAVSLTHTAVSTHAHRHTYVHKHKHKHTFAHLSSSTNINASCIHINDIRSIYCSKWLPPALWCLLHSPCIRASCALAVSAEPRGLCESPGAKQ